MNVDRLVKKSKKGNKKALLKLIMAEKNAYYKLAYTYTGNEPDAMDAMSEMIVIMYEKIMDLKKPEAFYTWSKTILVNCCKSILHKRKKLILMDEWPGNNKRNSLSNQEIGTDSALKLDIQNLLSYLNEEQREAIILKYFHDYDYETIAQLTDVSIGTVKSRVFYGLKK